MKTSNNFSLAFAIFLASSLAACSSLRLGNPKLAPNPADNYSHISVIVATDTGVEHELNIPIVATL